MVFQNYALWPHMTVGANITYGLRLRKLAAAEIASRGSSAGCGKVNLAGLSRALSGPAVRRSAAAGGAGPRARAEPRHPAARRAAVQSRREDPRAGARGDPQAAAGAAASPPSTSPTTRRRRCRSPTASRSCATGACCRWPRRKELYERPVNRFVADFVGTNNLIRAGVCTRAGTRRRHRGHAARARSRPDRRTRSARASAACSRCGRRTWCSAARRRERLRGRIAFASYLGNTLRYDVETESGLVSRSTCATRGTTTAAGGREPAAAFPASPRLAPDD